MPGKRDIPFESNEKRAGGCLGYTGDHTTELYGDYNIPSLLTNQYTGTDTKRYDGV